MALLEGSVARSERAQHVLNRPAGPARQNASLGPAWATVPLALFQCVPQLERNFSQEFLRPPRQATYRLSNAWVGRSLNVTLSGTNTTAGFREALSAPGRSAAIPDSQDVYGWLIGSWDLEVLSYSGTDLRATGIKGEVHFGWVLEGRAVQDVWIMPQIAARTGHGAQNNMYGSTLRVWDPQIQAWRIIWKNPVSGHLEEQIGRRSGNDIVQIGARSNRVATRWRFVEITGDSFHWIGETLQPDGESWTVEGEFLAKRRGLRNSSNGFWQALVSNSRSPEIRDLDDVYGWLEGSWDLAVTRFPPTGPAWQSSGEVHFARVLEGRAVQDVWIMPRRTERAGTLDQAVNRYGTTFRIWNPAIRAWNVTWIEPVTGSRDEMTARRVGNDIVQLGTHSDGTPIRWSFREITPDSFHWFGEALHPDGKTWRLEAEFRARRIAAAGD